MAAKSKSSKSPKSKGTKARKPRAPKSPHVDHKLLLEPMSVQAVGQDLPYLGYPRAVVTVTHCANTAPSNLFSTLDQLGLNGLSFQQCVYGSIISLGYSIDVDTIPDAPSSTLNDVIAVIENAPKA